MERRNLIKSINDLKSKTINFDVYSDKINKISQKLPITQLYDVLRKEIGYISEEIREIDNDIYYPNQYALREYMDNITNYKNFSQNKLKLEKEKEAILKFIEKIEEQKESEFMNRFRKLREKLSNLFQSVFPDSKIYIELEDENNIDSDILFYVKFKDKPKLPMFALSGGEKSIILILFLLSLYSISGSVIFLLDEIDAHIDPQNLKYFAQALASQKEESQIILVTLPRDETLARISDHIIMVLFRDGVSKAITISRQLLDEVINQV